METGQQSSRDVESSVQSQCPLCSGSVESAWQGHIFRYGQGESAFKLEVTLQVYTCAPCEFEFTDDEGERLKHEALCRHFGVLTPKEIRAIRGRHRLTRAEFAKITGLGEASLGRWENGAVIQTHANDRYLRLLAEPDGISKLLSVMETSFERTLRGGESNRQRFRSLAVTTEVREQQRVFQLRKAG